MESKFITLPQYYVVIFLVNSTVLATFLLRQESHKQLDDDVDLEAEIEEEMKQEELLRAERSHELRLLKQKIIAVRGIRVFSFTSPLGL